VQVRQEPVRAQSALALARQEPGQALVQPELVQARAQLEPWSTVPAQSAWS
jgi:hypothetical protein